MARKLQTSIKRSSKVKKATAARHRLFVFSNNGQGVEMGRNNALKEIPSIVPKKIRYDSLKVIDPLTETQAIVFQEFNKGKNLFLHGMAGTGKSFLAIYLAMKEILLKESNYDKLVVVRSTVPVRDSGFLPGTLDEKEDIYQLPYKAIFNEIFNYQPDLLDKLKEQGLYKFISTSYIRGITLHNTIVVVDEISSISGHELDSIITRLGTNSKIILCGDKSQSDFHRQSEKEGLSKFMRVIDTLPNFAHIEFLEEDIVRSDLVKQYIISKHKLGIEL